MCNTDDEHWRQFVLPQSASRFFGQYLTASVWMYLVKRDRILMYAKVQITFKLHEVMPVFDACMLESELPLGSFEQIPGTQYEWYRIYE